MKHKIVLVPFPFDDLSSQKVRPAVCLTPLIPPHSHVVVAFITSNISSKQADTDVVIDKSDPDFTATGLKVSSTVRLHRLITISANIVLRLLGELSASQVTKINSRLKILFDL